jgi:hypothetical protein
MTKISALVGASAILAFTAAGALAAPCAVGTTVNSQGTHGTQDKSSNADASTTSAHKRTPVRTRRSLRKARRSRARTATIAEQQ